MATKKTGNTFNNDNLNKAIEFVKKHIRYFAAGGLLIILILVLAMCASPKSSEGEEAQNTETVSPASEDFEVDANEAINDLIAQYYTAYAAGDADTLASIAIPLAENERTYIAMFSQYVEEYQNIQCYTKSGLDSNSYMVYVAMEIKFNGVDTAAPGLEFFYIRTNDEGSLYIDNLYSPYNLANKENALDTSVQNLLQELINEDDAIALQQEIQQRYDTAVASDENLATMVNTTIPNEIAVWKDSVLAQADEETTEDGTEQAEESDSETEAQSEQTVYTLDKVNVRVSADANSDRIGSVEKGTAIGLIGTEGDWSIVDYGGYHGYIKSEYLTTEAPGTDTGTDTDASAEETTDTAEEASNGIAEGTVITLQDSVNVRSGMSETAERIGTAYRGEKVTVVMSYSEGWTKVTWNNKTGYIKTSLLQ